MPPSPHLPARAHDPGRHERELAVHRVRGRWPPRCCRAPVTRVKAVPTVHGDLCQPRGWETQRSCSTWAKDTAELWASRLRPATPLRREKGETGLPGHGAPLTCGWKLDPALRGPKAALRHGVAPRRHWGSFWLTWSPGRASSVLEACSGFSVPTTAAWLDCVAVSQGTRRF